MRQVLMVGIVFSVLFWAGVGKTEDKVLMSLTESAMNAGYSCAEKAFTREECLEGLKKYLRTGEIK